MSEEKSAGASYLSALKQPVAQASGTAPARATETGQHEKRRSPRYRCQGSAHLRDLRSKIATWATFTDISLHGCYVEAMSSFTRGTELTLTIEVNGFRVVCLGLVQVVYPGLGMGLSFSTMSQQNREQLNQLVESLSHPSAILGVSATNSPLTSSLHENADPADVLREIKTFFNEREVLSREEFQRILQRHLR